MIIFRGERLYVARIYSLAVEDYLLRFRKSEVPNSRVDDFAVFNQRGHLFALNLGA